MFLYYFTQIAYLNQICRPSIERTGLYLLFIYYLLCAGAAGHE